MKYQIAQMLAQGGGAIVDNSSVAGLTGYVPSLVYAAREHGVVGLSKFAVIQYVGRGIRISVVCPGLIMTPMIERAFAGGTGVREWFESQQPSGHGGSPEEVARAVVWLCSDDASLITGVALPVDGGGLSGIW